MSTIKDRKGKDLIEAEEIKKRWQEYTEELYKKDLNDLDNHKGFFPFHCNRSQHHQLEIQQIWDLHACGQQTIIVFLLENISSKL